MMVIMAEKIFVPLRLAPWCFADGYDWVDHQIHHVIRKKKQLLKIFVVAWTLLMDLIKTYQNWKRQSWVTWARLQRSLLGHFVHVGEVHLTSFYAVKTKAYQPYLSISKLEDFGGFLNALELPSLNNEQKYQKLPYQTPTHSATFSPPFAPFRTERFFSCERRSIFSSRWVLAACQLRKFRKEGFKYSHPPNLSPAIQEWQI